MSEQSATGSAVVQICEGKPPAPIEGFDYESLQPHVAERVRESTVTIRSHVGRIVDSIYTIGMELVEVKRLLIHGEFGQWIDAEFRWGPDTAGNYMRVYSQLGKYRTIRNLPLQPTTLYALSAKSTPKHVLYELVQEIEAGTLDRGDPDLNALIKQRIDEAKQGSGKVPTPTEKAEARKDNQLRHAIAAVKLIRERLSEGDLALFRRLYPRGKHHFEEVLFANTPSYGLGFHTGDLLIGDDGLPLTEEALNGYLLDLASTPDNTN